MTRLKRLLLAAVLLAVVALGVLLGVDNNAPVALRLLNRETSTLPLFWWLYAAFVAGAAAGFALCAAGFARGKLNERRLRRTVAAREQELAALRRGDGTGETVGTGPAGLGEAAGGRNGG